MAKPCEPASRRQANTRPPSKRRAHQHRDAATVDEIAASPGVDFDQLVLDVRGKRASLGARAHERIRGQGVVVARHGDGKEIVAIRIDVHLRLVTRDAREHNRDRTHSHVDVTASLLSAAVTLVTSRALASSLGLATNALAAVGTRDDAAADGAGDADQRRPTRSSLFVCHST